MILHQVFAKAIPELLEQLLQSERQRQQVTLSAVEMYTSAVVHCNKLQQYEAKSEAMAAFPKQPLAATTLGQFAAGLAPPPLPVWDGAKFRQSTSEYEFAGRAISSMYDDEDR